MALDVWAPGDLITAAKLNRTLQKGTANTDVQEIKALLLVIDTRSTVLGYDAGGTLTTVTIKDGATVVSTITLGYTAGVLTSVTEQANGRTITTPLTYTTGVLTQIGPRVVS